MTVTPVNLVDGAAMQRNYAGIAQCYAEAVVAGDITAYQWPVDSRIWSDRLCLFHLRSADHDKVRTMDRYDEVNHFEMATDRCNTLSVAPPKLRKTARIW